MLGQLLHSFNPSRRGTPRQSSNLIESVTEDSHTRNLLFPDAQALYQSDSQQSFPQLFSSGSPAGGASNDGAQAGIDLDQHRDFRIIIAQDEAGAMPRTVLFDSKPGPGSADSPSAASERRGSRMFGPGGGIGGPMSPGQAPGAASAFTPGHGRRSSLAAQGSVPQSPTVSAFQRARTRGASISNMQTFEESAQNARSRESEEIVRTCLDCMFGSAPMAYRGPSNKLHIIPMEPRAAERNVTSPPLHEGFSSLGRSPSRRSRLATSYTASNIPPEPSPSTAETSQKEVRRRTILITRLFSVSPPDEVEMPDSSTSNSTTPTPGSSIGKGSSSFPFPHMTSSGSSQYSGRRTRPCRTPMYAIGIILHLPVSPPPPRSASHRAGSKSHGGQESLGSSFDSDRRAGWAFVDATFGVDSLLSLAGNSDVDDRVDVIGQHWDVIVRTLTSLQFLVQDKIMGLFKAAEQATPQSQPPSRNHGSTRSSHREPIMPPRRMLKLQPFALLFDPDVKAAVDVAADRVVRGMKVPRVITGQGRWGVWREEARWLGRWAGGREQNFFLFNLLTAFLGTHTEWLNILGPKSYRTKYREQQRNIAGEDITIANRTIIISADKMAARRLIFLLSNFLPASSHGLLEGASPMRPSTSTSLRGYSQSPPNTSGMARQQSLRRTINRKGHKSYPNMSALNGAKGSNPDLPEEKAEEKEEKRPPSRSAPHSRRPSQVHSIRSINATGLAIPSMVEDPAIRKGSTTTTSTVTPETAVPVAHFAVHRHNSGSTSSNEARPPSSGSLASVNLRHTLHRTGSSTASAGTDTSSRKWGSFMSFWNGSGRRESSTDHSDILQSTDDGVGMGGFGYRRTHNHSASKLEHMVQELQVDDFDQADSEDYEAAANVEHSPMSPGAPHSAARAIPARSKHLDSPLKLSVNENDGVIDVDIALPGFGSPVQSPLLPGLGNSVGSLEGSTFGPSFCSSAISLESSPPVNVAGWLARYHQDFALQGVQPYSELENDVRKSMSAEPTPVAAVSTPSMEGGPQEKWVHVCTALIADARTFTIKRLRLEPVPMTELRLEEKFLEETVMDLDETLADALEKGISSSGVSTPALTSSTASIQPATATPTQRTSQIQDKNHTPQRKSRLQEQDEDEDVSPKKQLPAPSSVATSTTVSTTASASSSRSSSRRGRNNGGRNNHQQEQSDAASTITSLETLPPRGNQECKSLVLGALDQIVRSVAAERTGNFMPSRVGKDDSSTNRTPKQSKRRATKSSAAESLHKESTLREGIRRWLAQVEDGN
ncbi:uncharacterized protein LTHEOB_4759 [Lasiodiplodia theobromae]|uniref:uncharacterized protein n=1 Tax=Lasiodiplodia theobromae TaxID=45133 RepID=UPI0015C36088|nr:uncharacterized protein LTHEOB_4759 [Lasiodiplodia theobromae]KAF4546107.1 hypothetical protein LTHEOB_4759 [Lasiodiplodia theobromae]